MSKKIFAACSKDKDVLQNIKIFLQKICGVIKYLLTLLYK